jgi:hypothetical protein
LQTESGGGAHTLAQPLHLGAEAAAVRIGTKAQAFGFGEFSFKGAGEVNLNAMQVAQ